MFIESNWILAEDSILCDNSKLRVSIIKRILYCFPWFGNWWLKTTYYLYSLIKLNHVINYVYNFNLNDNIHDSISMFWKLPILSSLISSGDFLWDLFMCVNKLSFLEQSYGQRGQWKGLTPSCVRWCCSNLNLLLKLFPHPWTSHLYLMSF